MLTARSPILAPVSKLLPPDAMATFVGAANDSLECGCDYNDAVRAGWTAVKMDWIAPPVGKRWVKKDSPGPSDVHAEVPLGDKRKKKTIRQDPGQAGEGAASRLLKIVKADDEQRIAYGWASVITIKGTPFEDSQGDIIDAETLAKATADFMMDVRRGMAMHQRNAENKIDESMVKGIVLHSFPLTDDIAKALGISSDMEGWIVGVKVFDDDVWKRVKSGELASFSIGGRGYRVPVEPVGKFNPHHAPAGGPGGGQFTSGDGGGESESESSTDAAAERARRLPPGSPHSGEFAGQNEDDDVTSMERPTLARERGVTYRHRTSGKEIVSVGGPPTKDWEAVGKVIGTTVKDYIDDFLASDAPQFQGKSKEEIIQMALAAWYGGKSIDLDEIGKAYADAAVAVIAEILSGGKEIQH